MCEMSAGLMSMNGQFAICVLLFVMHVQKNVQCLKMSIEKNAHKNVAHVLMNVEKWLVCNSIK